MTSGYSGKPLSDKLGIQPGTTVCAVGAPDDYLDLLDPLPTGAQVAFCRHIGGLPVSSFIHCFVQSRGELAAQASSLAAALEPGGTLWLSWPKLAAAKKLGLPADISEDTLRELLLPLGIVDVKVCAVSEIWSGLKFLWRVR